MFASWLLALAAAASPGVAVDLDPLLPCGLAVELPGALRGQGVEPTGGSLLTARADGDAVDLRLTDRAGVLQAARRLQPKPEDCPALARVVAMLVRSWVTNPLRPRPRPVERRPDFVAGEEPEPPPPAFEPEPVALPAPSLVAPQRPPPPTEEPRSIFSVMAAGGAAVGPGDSVAATVCLTGDWTVSGRWGLAIDGGQQSDRTRVAAATLVSAQLHWLGVAARFEVLGTQRHHLYASLGAQLVHLGVSATSVGQNAGLADLFLPAFTGQLESRHALGRSLFVLARLSVQARLREERVVVDAVELSVPPWGFGLQAGLGWNFP